MEDLSMLNAIAMCWWIVPYRICRSKSLIRFLQLWLWTRISQRIQLSWLIRSLVFVFWSYYSIIALAGHMLLAQASFSGSSIRFWLEHPLLARASTFGSVLYFWLALLVSLLADPPLMIRSSTLCKPTLPIPLTNPDSTDPMTECRKSRGTRTPYKNPPLTIY